MSNVLIGVIVLAALLAGFWVGWLCCRTWYRFESGWREELERIDEDRKRDGDTCPS